MQGLAQAGLEVQSFNAALVVGRVIGFAIGMAILWFFVGPAFADNPIGVIVAFFALGFGGLLLGQWLMLLLLRR